MREEYNSILSTPTEAAVLADTDTLVKPKYRPDISARLIYWSISTHGARKFMVLKVLRYLFSLQSFGQAK